ncbi:hypothetical protein llap_2420 [Limosa lapponica baueri]|uniref:Uncharacterized protein n=1 Tax=Limosa lapponica baueri TaxID=1758121 RepID=A0A2I0UMH3_LIMLA|nr:hypothetical protein llap_2420 [Limosa lapponica baueri]
MKASPAFLSYKFLVCLELPGKANLHNLPLSFFLGKVDAPFVRAALNPFIPQPALVTEVALIQVQDLALVLIEPHDVHMGTLLEVAQVPLDSIPSLRHVNCTTQLGVISKLAKDALDPIMSLMKILNNAGPIMDPRGTPLVTNLHLDIELLTTTLYLGH